ncbi:Vsp/OspC family lipoprotein [Borrelia puertoricensis]|uniref:Vsp/OspC family lipoprotein n=1 Tax=Borrelia puertoricensis TaxID=2756107 RepID=UPI00322173AB
MKRITLCALFLTLFLLISCNTSGKNLTDDEVAKSDGTVIDLAKITKNIKDSVAFAKSVKEIHTLVKSIDELAKAIDQKVDNATHQLVDGAGEKNHNGSLIAGAFQVISTVKVALIALETEVGIPDTLKKKLGEAKAKSNEFLNKLEESKDQADAAKAIDIIKGDGSKGGNELKALNQLVGELLKTAEDAVESAIKELTTSVKPSN